MILFDIFEMILFNVDFEDLKKSIKNLGRSNVLAQKMGNQKGLSQKNYDWVKYQIDQENKCRCQR